MRDFSDGHELAKIEYGIRELQPRQRDHVVHSVRVFLLGIFINETLLKNNPVDALQWKLAGLTHDVGYPLEIAARIPAPFAQKLNDIAAGLLAKVPRVTYRGPRLEGLENLTDGRNGIKLIQDRLNEWGLAVDAENTYRERTEAGFVCHGVISALAVLLVLDLLYARWNPTRAHESLVIDGIDWNQKWFETDNVSACAAIFLHNLDLKYFDKSRINPQKASVAFLLRLADTLQEWERPSKMNPDGFPDNKFDLEFDGNEIIYRADVDDGIKKNLKGTLDASLEGCRVRIVLGRASALRTIYASRRSAVAQSRSRKVQ